MTVPDRPRISLLGTSALLFEAPGAFDLPHQRRIWALAATASKWPDIREAVPGITNLLLTFETPPRQLDALIAALNDGAGIRRKASPSAVARSGCRSPMAARSDRSSSPSPIIAACPSMTSWRSMPRRSTRSSPWAAIPAIATSAAWIRASPCRGDRHRCSAPPAARYRSAGRRPASPPRPAPAAGTLSDTRAGLSSTHPGRRRLRSCRAIRSVSRSNG